MRLRSLSTVALALGIVSCADTPPPSAPTHATAKPEARSNPPESPIVPPGLRLPTTVVPRRNVARLTIDPARETFDGELDIEVDVLEPTNVVWLNQDGLTLARAEIEAGGKTLSASVRPEGANLVGLVLPKPLEKGRATIHLAYAGKLSSTEVDGASRQKEGNDFYVYSHFEPLAARRVFPCFDEPSFKSPWQLTLRVKKGDKAVSNTPVVSETEGKDGLVSVKFAETKPLPSYLVAFAVGPFGIVDGGKIGKKGTPFRVIVPRGKEPWAKFAIESTGPVVSLLETYFGEAYPYEKLDLIAVPLFGGAMENPGLVTYRQSLILGKPGQESTGFRRAFASVNAHELAHQWFGDLVTTAWWDDLWLNEAFATWMTPKIIERFKPEWDFPSSRANQASNAMRTDSLTSARAIRQPIVSNDDIKNAFDGITYQKGAAVIAMFERWVGPEVFQRGVQRYMREHAHQTATSKDFLEAISKEAGRDVAVPFATFLDRPGVPLVATETSCSPTGAKLTLSQSRYLPSGAEAQAGAFSPWKVPFCARFGKGKKADAACTLLADTKGSLDLPYCPDWTLPNDAASGYYRVGLGKKDLSSLTRHFDKLTAPEKISTVGNLSALVRNGSLDSTAMLELLPVLARDKNVHVVDLAVDATAALRDGGMLDAASRPKFAKLVQELFGAKARALGLHAKPNEDEETRWLRPWLVDLVADSGEDAALRAECTKLAKAWLSDRNAIEPELLGSVLGIAASFGDHALFDAYLAEAKKAPERIDRERLVWALGQFREPAIVTRALDLVLGTDFDPRESVRILWAVTRLPSHVPYAWAFVTKHFDAIVARLPRDSGAGFPSIGAAFCDDQKRPEVEAFFKDRSARYVGGPRTLAQSLEGMHLCSVYRSREAPKVNAYFATRK